MVDLSVQLGDVATWLQATGGLAQAGYVLNQARHQRAESFATRLREETGLDAEALASSIERNPVVGRLLLDGLEAAIQASAEEKQHLLARVVANAVNGDRARINESDVLLRTIAALEPYHVRLLVQIATPRPGRGALAGTRIEGALTGPDLASSLPPDQADLVEPMLQVLEREGLITNIGSGTYSGTPAWSLAAYGRRLLRYLNGIFEVPDLRTAEVVGYYDPTGAWVFVRNLGPGRADVTVLKATCDGDSVIGVPDLPMKLDAGEEQKLGSQPIPPNAGVRIRIEWTDDRGEERSFTDSQFPPST